MEGILTAPFFKRYLHRQAAQQTREQQECIADLERIGYLMKCLDARFNLTEDDDLLDACIYQRNALAAEYRHHLKRARALGIQNPVTCSKLQFEGRNGQWDR